MELARQKILSLVESLEEYNLNGHYYSLTINYINIVNSYEDESFNASSVKEIIQNCDHEIKSFNLSVNNYGRYGEGRYKGYFKNVDLVFYSGGNSFTFSSNYLSNRKLGIGNIDKIFELLEIHEKTSKELYDVFVK